MAKSKPAELSNGENLLVVLGALALMVLCVAGVGIGSTVRDDTDADALVGLIVGAVVWAFVFGALSYWLTPTPEPLETSPADEDQPEPEHEPEDEDEPVDLDAFEVEQARLSEEYPPRRKG